MNCLSHFLLLLFCLVFIADSDDSFFSSPFTKNIDKIVKAVQDSSVRVCADIQSVIQNDFSFFQNAYFGDMEGSGVELLTKAEVEQQLRFVLLAERARLTEQRDLKEGIVTLGTENVKVFCSLSKYLVEVPELPKAQLAQYNISFSGLEKAVLDFFTETNETAQQEIIRRFDKRAVQNRREALWDNRDHRVWNENIVEPVLAEVLKRNQFSDDVFILFYRLLRNHAKVLTVATAIEYVLGENAELLSTGQNIGREYEEFLLFIGYVNKWREFHGRKFTELYTKDQLEAVFNLTDLPVPEHQNLFRFDPRTEAFGAKYFYVTLKACGLSSQNRMHHMPATYAVAKHESNCTAVIFRHIRRSHLDAEKDITATARLFRNLTMRHFNQQEPVDFATFPAAKRFALFGKLSERLNLIAVAVYRDDGLSLVYDNMYQDDGGFKVSVDVFVMNAKKKQLCTGTFIKDCEDEVVSTKVALKVVGYFLAPGQKVL